ncbi:hypothetical protein VTN31DRAFT_4496 [Thermomyces dupontii]|uniref:mitochondrial 54S ribosomal protein bL34m n=1 Tax=Talaromyces thermophilus TaxID=28565 RepID=UPI0037449C3A
MLSLLRCTRAAFMRPLPTSAMAAAAVRVAVSPSRTRTLSHLAARAPSRPLAAATTTTTTTTTMASTWTSSLLRPSFSSPIQSRAFSASAHLAAKRDTYNPSRLVQKRRHGFLARVKTRGGRNILKRRRAKKRKTMSW